ncbi:Plant-specific TFIIB-related protein PTF2 [Bienertia sinuspersici]
MAVCRSCKSNKLVIDEVTGGTVCSSCGIVQDFEDYQHTFCGVSGPEGTFVRVGTSGSGTNYSYKERKLRDSKVEIEDIASRLSFSDARTREVKNMVMKVTDGEFGLGNWFTVLVGACCYIVMRQNNKPLPISEVIVVVGCELYEMGKMVTRVVDFLGLELKEFDLVGLLEKTFRKFTGFSEVDKEKIDMMVKQGNFVIQCAIKWFLTTGRRPEPVVVAVLVFVGAVNGIEVKIEEVAKEMNVAIRTCKLRYKELLEAMVEVAKKLPWGKEVNVKNIVKNAPFVLKYMEMKSLEERQSEKAKFSDGFDLADVVGECLNKEVGYGGAQNSLGCVDGLQRVEDLKVAHEELAKVYSKFKAEFSNRRLMNENEPVGYGDRLSGLDFQLIDEWWDGRSEMCEKLLIEQLLEKDVGLDALPPSYIRGCLAVKRRQEKIRAAKVRINSIVNPATSLSSNVSMQSGLGVSDDIGTVENVDSRKKRRKRNDSIDWEDFIIETLLLHQVKQEEIEKGHYNALLGLHVFKSGIV